MAYIIQMKSKHGGWQLASMTARPTKKASDKVIKSYYEPRNPGVEFRSLKVDLRDARTRRNYPGVELV